MLFQYHDNKHENAYIGKIYVEGLMSTTVDPMDSLEITIG